MFPQMYGYSNYGEKWDKLETKFKWPVILLLCLQNVFKAVIYPEIKTEPKKPFLNQSSLLQPTLSTKCCGQALCPGIAQKGSFFKCPVFCIYNEEKK